MFFTRLVEQMEIRSLNKRKLFSSTMINLTRIDNSYIQLRNELLNDIPREYIRVSEEYTSSDNSVNAIEEKVDSIDFYC